MLVVVLIAAGLVGLGLYGSGALTGSPGPTPIPGPEAVAAGFVRPFAYVIPAETKLRASGGEPSSAIVAWIEGPDLSVEDPHYGGQFTETANARGIIVASADQSWSHSPAGRFTLRTEPAEFLTDLRYVAQVAMGAISDTTLDGRPALTVTITATEYNDIHVSGPTTGMSREYVMVGLPCQLTVAKVDGKTIFVLAWARTARALADWTPVADRFVASIHFLPAP